MAPWKLPFIVAGVVVPIAAAFMLGGPGVGVAVGALVTVTILAVAARQRPEGPIGTTADDGERHVLIVAAAELEDPADMARITRVAGLGGKAEKVDVRVLVPARIGFLDRWASDVEGARHRAQQRLVVTVAALAKAGVAAEARVGDEDIVQAVEDQLQSYPATEVVLVGGGEDVEDEAAEKLRSRLRAEFHQVRVGGAQQT
jgi:Baseplate J-like protein